MVSKGIDLGKLGLASTASGLTLELTSHAKVASPADGLDLAQHELTSAKPWIRKGTDFKLSIRIDLDDVRSNLRPDVLADAISHQLGLPNRWKQLCLRPVSVQSSAAGLNSIDVTVRLDYCDDEQTKRQSHKLGQGVPFHDISLPPGVLIVDLNEIHLNMHMTRTATRKRQKLEPCFSDHTIPLSSHRQHSTSYLDGRELPVDSVPCDPPRIIQPRALKQEDQDRVSTSGSKYVSGWDNFIENECSDSMSSSFLAPQQTRKRSHSTRDSIWSELDDVLMIFDAAFRLAITSNPTRPAKGIRVVTNEDFQHLADRFPSVWSPGYLPAMASTAVFLPTLCHALASVCNSHAQSSTIKAKLAEIDRQETLHAYSSQPARERVEARASSDKQTSLVARLWRTMESSLYHKEAARGLKPCLSYEEDVVKNNRDDWTDGSLTEHVHHDDDQDGLDEVLCDSDSEGSMLVESLITPERRAYETVGAAWNEYASPEDPKLIQRAAWHMEDGQRGPHVDAMQDDEVLSLCESVDSMLLGECVDVAASQGPDLRSIPRERRIVVQQATSASLSDEEDGIIPI